MLLSRPTLVNSISLTGLNARSVAGAKCEDSNVCNGFLECVSHRVMAPESDADPSNDCFTKLYFTDLIICQTLRNNYFISAIILQ